MDYYFASLTFQTPLTLRCRVFSFKIRCFPGRDARHRLAVTLKPVFAYMILLRDMKLKLKCIFRNWSRFGSYNIYLHDTRISYTQH